MRNYLLRFIRFVFRTVRIIVDVILFICFLPITIVFLTILFLKRNEEKKKTVFFVGLEHVINKTLVRSEWFEEQGFRTLFFSYEHRATEKSIKSNNKILKSNIFFTFDLIDILQKFIKYKPVYVELYSTKPFRSIVVSMICKLSRTLCIFILRGLYTKIKSQCLLARIVDWVLYRELYMPEILLKNKVKQDKLIFDPNKVKLKPLDSYGRKKKNVLFLNGFKRWRNIELVIKSVKYVKIEIPDVKYYLVGARGEVELNYAFNFVKEEGVDDWVIIEEWTENPERYYENASVFVLPADLIYCNYSLLEAMERGVPAIVADVEDANKIITHNKNGFLSQKDEVDIAKYIIMLLSNEELRQKMGMEARKTIENNFNHLDRMRIVESKIKSFYLHT